MYEISKAGERSSPGFLSYLDLHELEKEAVLEVHVEESEDNQTRSSSAALFTVGMAACVSATPHCAFVTGCAAQCASCLSWELIDLSRLPIDCSCSCGALERVIVVRPRARAVVAQHNLMFPVSQWTQIHAMHGGVCNLLCCAQNNYFLLYYWCCLIHSICWSRWTL